MPFFLSHCRGYDRQEIIRQHDLLIEKSKKMIPEMGELAKNERVFFTIEGFPKLEKESNLKCYFLKDGRYVCVLNLLVEVKNDQIIRVISRKLKIMELERIFLDDSNSVHKRYRKTWRVEDSQKIKILTDNKWDLSTIGIEKKAEVKNSDLIYKSWEFLYR